MADDEERLTVPIIELATMYGRRGVTALQRQAGWVVTKKRVKRIWQREGLKVLWWQPKKGRS